MPPSTEEIFTEISKDFNICWNFPNCIERIDAKHIRIHCPPNSVSQYSKYKQCHSIVLQAFVDANLKSVTVDVGAYGKQNDGGVFRNSALYQSLETRNLQLPEDTVLPLAELALPQIFVGDEAYLRTTYIMKPYSRRTLDRSKAIFNYRPSRARRVVKCAFGICSSKWRILDKSIETKVDTVVETVKCTALLHNIIIDFEDLHDFSSIDCGSLDANGGTQFKKCRMHNSVSASVKQTRDLLCEFFHSPADSVPWPDRKLLETGRNSKSSLHCVIT